MSYKIERKYPSPAAAAIHEGVSDLHEIGAVDARTMRIFDELCLVPEDVSFEATAAIQSKIGV